MLIVLLAVVFIWMACRILAIGIHLIWGIVKILFPLLIAIGLIYIGLECFAFPIIAILGAVFLVCHLVKA